MAGKENHIQDNFRNAFNGLRWLVAGGRTIKVHLAIALAVVIAGFLFGITIFEWVLIALCVGMVLAAEAMNTAIEKLCDHVTPEYHESIRRVKDLAAGAVLIVSMAAALAGLLIFLPYLIACFGC